MMWILIGWSGQTTEWRIKIIKETNNTLKVVWSHALSLTSTVILPLIKKGDYTLNSHFGRVSVRLTIGSSTIGGHHLIYRPICPGLISSELGG